MNKTREIYFDYLRILSIFAVICIHIVGLSWYTENINTPNWHILNIYDSIARFCVPVFVMISGALFLNQKKEVSIKKLYSKNILRLVTSLLFWSLAYAVFINLFILKQYNFTSIYNSFISGNYHLWFIPMLIGLYIFVPILRKICESKELEKYFLIMAFIISSLLPLLEIIPLLDNYINHGIFKFSISFVAGFTGYFVLGHYLNTYNISKKKEIISYVLGFISLLFTIIGTYLLSKSNNQPSEVLYNYLLANTYFISSAIFIFFKYHISKIKLSDKITNIIINISNLSFGIYLVHDFFIQVLDYLRLTERLQFNLIIISSIPLLALIIFIGSLIISYVISKIPILNKYII